MKALQIIAVPIDQLQPDPAQPRKTFSEESLVGLGRTLADQQLQPIIACRNHSGFRILDGERRWRAGKLAGCKTIDVLVIDTPLRPSECLQRQLIANLQREDLAPMEKAEAIHSLMEGAKCSAAEVSLRLGLSPAQVSKLLTLLSLPENIQDDVRSGKLPASAAYELARVDDAAERNALAADASAGRLTRDALSRKIRRVQRSAQSDSTSGGRSLARATVNLGKGRTITLAGRGLSIETLIEWIEQLLMKAKKARAQGLALPTFVKMLQDQNKASGDGGGAGTGGAEGGSTC